MGVSLYTRKYVRAQSVVVLSDAQPYERGHPIYPKYVENPTYIPETSSKYVESPPIYLKYVRNQP